MLPEGGQFVAPAHCNADPSCRKGSEPYYELASHYRAATERGWPASDYAQVAEIFQRHGMTTAATHWRRIAIARGWWPATTQQEQG